MEFLNEINKLKTENLELRMIRFVPICNEQQKRQIEAYITCIGEIKANSAKLAAKIDEIMEKERYNKLSRSNTTVVTSRADENGVDRMIKNMKVVYESQIKTLRD